MPGVEFLAEWLEEAGFGVASLEPVPGGYICVAGMATLRGGGRVFAKTLAQAGAGAGLVRGRSRWTVGAAPSLTHGDLWPGNILAGSSGEPALIDPAVSCSWPEVDLADLWCAPRPPTSERFFAVYDELARPFDGWRDQAQLLRIWDLFSVVAHGLDTWGAADIVRTLIAPFRFCDPR